MIWAFIDYENTGSLEDIDYQVYQRIFVFCGPKNSKLKLGDAEWPQFLSIEIIRLKTMGENNLDFHMAYYLGKFSEIANQEIEFHVITKDKGFDGLVNHIKKIGRKCKRVILQTKTKKLPQWYSVHVRNLLLLV
ncbi:PIN domain-containing protein [Candidatus Vondammii sp. HM_W22]|uniref:PIN domain-containing protein n=1 Tax=Candidatus Vondammii sp. HM_W22 TaxID=2687299 RepID=UPI001F13D237|nr:PIN domain-containing protein [Candidatus Vondammii sp. HM_W22]